MSREDLGQYTDNELALRFANDEGLYQARHLTWAETCFMALETFEPTDAQLDELRGWWDDYQEDE